MKRNYVKPWLLETFHVLKVFHIAVLGLNMEIYVFSPYTGKYGLQKTLYLNIFRAVRETYEEFCQASNLELFAKLVNGLTAQSRFCVRLWRMSSFYVQWFFVFDTFLFTDLVIYKQFVHRSFKKWLVWKCRRILQKNFIWHCLEVSKFAKGISYCKRFTPFLNFFRRPPVIT